MSMEQVLLAAGNSPLRFGSIKIVQNAVDMYAGDVDIKTAVHPAVNVSSSFAEVKNC